MTDPTSLLTLGLVLAAGAGLGFWFGRLGTAGRLAQAQRDLEAHKARAADVLRAAQGKAAQDLKDARAAWVADASTARHRQRAEIEKLTRHLTDAYDELDRLRVVAARQPALPDTGQGFAATMPLGDL